MSEQYVPETFAADAVGEPGQRAFFLQARGGFGAVSFPIEKQQVIALAEKLREVLILVDPEDTVRETAAARDPALTLTEPVDAGFRIGTIGLAYDEDDDRIVVLIQPVEVSEEEVPPVPDENSVRFVLRRDQVRAFVLHAIAVAAEGRPLCQLCGLPMDPEGHLCPASNGHHPE